MATTTSRPEPITAMNVMKRPSGEGVKTMMIIDGVEYDVTEWKMKHPGGIEIMEKYHEKDATEVFYAFHTKETAKMLNSLPHKTPKEQPLVDDRLKSFRAFRQKLEDQGFFERSYAWYAYKTFTTLALWALGIFFAFTGNWMISACFMGVFWQQAGWLSHEYCHHDVFKSRKANNAFVYFSSNFLQGYSVNWWKDRHNTHHAITNVLEDDPDVSNLPLFLWDVKDIGFVYKPEGEQSIKFKIAKHLVPYQAYYWIPFTPLLKIIWMLQSFLFSRELHQHPNKSLRATYWFEHSLLLAHHVWVAALLYWTMPSLYAATMWWLLANGIGGCFIAIIVFTSHYACDLYDPNDRCQLNFVDLQLYTTRNINPGVFMDWFAGGLNYQIEHHLFPQMARNRLHEVSLLTRQWCAENNVPYQCESFTNCIKLLLLRLEEVALAWRKQVLN